MTLSFQPLNEPHSLQMTLKLSDWFQKNRRPLPWRESRDPYRIWVSEVMLQQTTVAAVVPYYERFMKLFPTLDALAQAPEGEVLAAWAGLGYYSRARRLKEAALKLAEMQSFPQTHTELLKLPGFGPYTARAVAALAFGEKVGVLDGNAIRVLTRLLNYKNAWWTSSAQRGLQVLSDTLSKSSDPYTYNQALMELGATVCTPKSPVCAACPLSTHCGALKSGSVSDVPMSKPRPAKQVWIWRPEIVVKRNKLGVVTNDYAPFLKGQLLPPGKALPAAKAPSRFAFKHNITCYDIYVQLEAKKSVSTAPTEWIPLPEIPLKIPSSLIKKALIHHKVIEPAL